MMERVDLKGRPDQREGKKASSGYFFSPWENPSLFGRSPEDCERKAKSSSVTARPWFHKSLLLRQKQPPIFTDGGSLFYNEGLEQSNMTVRQVIAHRRPDGDDSLISAKRKLIFKQQQGDGHPSPCKLIHNFAPISRIFSRRESRSSKVSGRFPRSRSSAEG